MSDYIRLHPQYGLNPTVSICIICKQDKNEVALLGAAYKGEAPRRMITSIEPCDDCREKYLEEGKGVLVLEAEKTRNNTPNPTGALAVITEESFQRIFNMSVPKRRIAYIEPGLLEQLGAFDPKEKPDASL